MNLAGDDPEHVIVVPGGLFAPTADAGLATAIGGDEVESNFAEQGEVAGGGAIAHPAVILTEGAGFTHQRSEVERYAKSGNFRASLALRNVPVSKPRRVVVGRAPLPERLDA